MKKQCETLKTKVNQSLKGYGREMSISCFNSSSSVKFTLDEFSTHYNPEDFQKGLCDFIFKIVLSKAKDEEGELIAMFRIKDQIGCAGMILIHDLLVMKDYRNRSIGKSIIEFVEEFARNFGYGVIQGIDNTKNEVLKKILIQRDWKVSLSFLNNRTGNELNLYHYVCNEKKDS